MRPDQYGGPLVDAGVGVVGVNIAKLTERVAYAVPSDVARRVAGELRGRREAPAR